MKSRDLYCCTQVSRVSVDVLDVLDGRGALGLDAVVADHGAPVHVLYRVAPVLEPITSEIIEINTF